MGEFSDAHFCKRFWEVPSAFGIRSDNFFATSVHLGFLPVFFVASRYFREEEKSGWALKRNSQPEVLLLGQTSKGYGRNHLLE